MLATIALIILVSILLFISILHIYWAFGGKWASQDVFPVLEGNRQLLKAGYIPTIPTLIVAALLVVAAGLFLWYAGVIALALPEWIRSVGVWTVTGVFAARAIGEFRYVGFFKTVYNSGFARLDTRFFSPLCLFIAILALIVVIG